MTADLAFRAREAALRYSPIKPPSPGGLGGGMRIIAAHAYHRIDYDEVWVTLRDDVPLLDEAVRRWRQTQA
jgi:Protein of unknown function DUF86